jgi:hypothetical protein
LAFVTVNTHAATSSNIADYDAFVTAEADSDPALAALATTWKVIGSTSTVNAVDHLGVLTSPIYNLHGDLVATGSVDMFDGTLTSPIDYDENGGLRNESVWTGSHANGQKFPSEYLGASITEFGESADTGSGWLEAASIGTALEEANFYAISGPLEVPLQTPVPEPDTISLMLGPLLLVTHRWWRARRAARTTRPDPASH